MTELELIEMFGKEMVSFLAIILVYVLFVKPKDVQISELVDANKQIVKENSEQLGKISNTMEKIADEMTTLADNQKKLNEGQDELWREIILIKKEK